MRTWTSGSGLTMPVLGLGAWHLGDDPVRRNEELRALQRGIDLGLDLIDTAEMYGDGASERLVGEAIAGRRDEVVLVSKVYPWNAASPNRMRSSCETSLRRLGTDRLDLYLLHWPGGEPFERVLEGFSRLREEGKILHWGVSNCDAGEMQEILSLPGGADCAVNQVLYNLGQRGVEADLMDVCVSAGVGVMAYTPLGSGRLCDAPVVQRVAARHAAPASSVALAWTLRSEGVLAIPKAGRVQHVEENARAMTVHLTEQDLTELDEAFPPPSGPVPLEMI